MANAKEAEGERSWRGLWRGILGVEGGKEKFDVRDEEEVLEKLLEAKVNGERGGGGCGRRCE